MSFQQHYARSCRLLHESGAWRLLRADNAPIILTFLTTAFANTNEVPYDQARVTLTTELQRLQSLGTWESQTSASTYLNQWIHAGWLREMDDTLTKTDASEVALRFCQGLAQRTTGTTASRLRIVQQAVRDLAIAINPDTRARITLLEEKKTAIQHEIDALQRGDVQTLSANEQSERLTDIYQLAYALTYDFRRLEDDIRQLERTVRTDMIAEHAGRGDVLKSVLEQEAKLTTTDAGRAFDGFFQLLCDEHRALELTEQLRDILKQPVANSLHPQHKHYLTRLMPSLTGESERVFHIRRRSEESLRAYIESGAALEQRAVNQLLNQLEQAAVTLTQQGVTLKHRTALQLPTGTAKITAPETLQLRSAESTLPITDITPQTNHRTPALAVLAHLETVPIDSIAKRIQTILVEHGAMTLANIIAYHPISAGLEELVTYVRVAKSVNAVELPQHEQVTLWEPSGHCLRATLPTYQLHPDLFATEATPWLN